MSAVAITVEEELRAFEEGEIDPARFPHREHVRLGFEMLRRHSFLDAATRFATGLRRLTSRAGRPQAYNETITIAFLALIGERLARGASCDWAEFLARNNDLTNKRVLEHWYEPDDLRSEIARQTFVLPPARSR